MKIFISSSLRNEGDKQLYWYLRQLIEAKGINVYTIGVDIIPSSPSEISRLEWKWIDKCDAFIGIVGKRYRVNGYLYSYSVNEEINYAYQLRKPIYLFVEEGVLKEGGIGTKADVTISFNRDIVFTDSNLPDILNEIIEDIPRRKTEKRTIKDYLPLVTAFLGGLIGGAKRRLVGAIIGSLIGGLTGYGLKKLIE